MKKGTFIIGLIVVGMVFSACSPPASVEEEFDSKVPIRLETAIKDSVEAHYITIGEVVPKNQVDVVLKVQGIVDRVFVKPGDFVDKDSPILTVENNIPESTLDSTESQLRTLRDNLAISYNAALTSYNNKKALYDSGVISKSEFDQSYDQLLTTQKQYEDSRNNYNNQIENLKESVSDLTVKSTIKGQVASVFVSEGELSSNQIVATVIDNSQLYVETMISVDLKRRVALNETVQIKTDSIQPFIGVIEEIDQLPNQESKLYSVRIKIQESDDLYAGDYAEIVFTTEEYQAYLIPSKAIVRRGLEQYIWVYEGNELRKKVVETGLSKGDWVEIKDIFEPITFVVSGQNNLSINDEFEVVE